MLIFTARNFGIFPNITTTRKQQTKVGLKKDTENAIESACCPSLKGTLTNALVSLLLYSLWRQPYTSNRVATGLQLMGSPVLNMRVLTKRGMHELLGGLVCEEERTGGGKGSQNGRTCTIKFELLRLHHGSTGKLTRKYPKNRVSDTHWSHYRIRIWILGAKSMRIRILIR